jgi:putative ABC transport system substrate-binding protein
MNKRRRWLAAGAAWPALAWLGTLRAQANQPLAIGWLEVNGRDFGQSGLNAFKEGMAALGWQIGTQYVLERYADGRMERLPVLAQELAAKKLALIVAHTSPAVRAAAAAAPTLAVVVANGDPMSTGTVKSLARPGGMVTGLSNVVGDLNQKLVELLIETLPRLQRVGFLADPTSRAYEASVSDARRAAERLRVDAVIVEMAKPEDIEATMAQLAKANVQALVMLPSPWFVAFAPTILRSVLAQRWPVVASHAAVARQGGLFSYGPDRNALFRRSAYYVDRILKGARPGDLPIEQPTTFEPVLNLKTAAALGIVIPPAMRVRATEVIE